MQKGILLLIICLGLTTNLLAQQVEQITLDEAIDIALENNYQLKQAENDLGLAETQEWSEKADFLPSLNASASGSKRIGRQFNDNTGEFGDFTANSFGGSFSTSIPVFNGFDNILSLRSSKFDIRSSRENLQWVKETIIFNTASAYLEVILNEELLQIAEENLASSQKQLEQVKAQVEVGSRPTVDLYNQESTVASNELEVVNRQNNLQFSKLQLIRQLQVDPLNEYEFTIPEVASDELNLQNYDLDQLVIAALENRSDLQREKLNIQSIEQQLKIAKGSLYPSLNFSASISSNFNDISEQPILDDNGNPVPDPNNPGGFLTETIPFNDQFFDQNISRSFSLSLNIPIFNNLNRRTNMQVQKVNYKNAQLALENTRLQVVQEVNQAYNDYQAVLKRLESTEKALIAAEKTYETQQERYQVGAGTLIELSDANAQYVQAQANRAQALFNFIFQQKLLDYYIGRLNEDISLN